jgi:hypothetical protein
MRDVTTSSDEPKVRPLSEADVQLRQQIRRYVLEHSEPWHREHLGRLDASWERYNAEHFAGEMVYPVMLLSETSNPRSIGDCSPRSGLGCRSQIRIRPSLLRGTHPLVRDGTLNPEGLSRVVEDVLLHEMIHQWQQEVTGRTEESYHGHGTAFRDKANEIGAKLGLPPVRAKHQKESAGPQCQYWPHEVRPEGYYYGAYVAAYVASSRDGGADETVKGYFVPRDLEAAVPVLRRHFDAEELARSLLGVR